MHFYAYRASQRGPSIRLPFAALENLDCPYLTEKCLHTRSTLSPIPSEDSQSDSGYSSSADMEQLTYELYIPAPAELSREQAFSYHVATRNFLAHTLGRPLVGEKLSIALSGLWNRMREWLPKQSLQANFTSYCEEQGYLNFADNSEHALACLKFAEDARLRDLWVDSFVHCVGMHERLDLSPEWGGLSRTTVALITRACLEMDLHIARVTRALGVFLEEELGPEYLGLSKPARDHLDHFRSCLHTFYVEKLGYFPPGESVPWSKGLWSSMYQEFQFLYDYLVDNESSCDPSNLRGVNGGICVVQNVQAFDDRHGYTSLPHPLPLYPESAQKQHLRKTPSQKGLRAFKLGRTNSGPEQKYNPKQALANATNQQSGVVLGCPLVQEYQRFERQKLEEKLDLAEARKVRWLLIYGVLQMLTSIMIAPMEVRDIETSSYPVCVLTMGCPSWADNESQADQEREVPMRRSADLQLVPQTLEDLEGRISRISIHPDCEAKSAEDFFASSGFASGDLSRKGSNLSLNNLTPQPLRINTQLSRTGTFRESVHSSVSALHKSVVGSLGKRNSFRRNSLVTEPVKMPPFVEIVVEEYGNGLRIDGELHDKLATVPAEDFSLPVDDPLQGFDFDLAAVNGEPTLEHQQIDHASHARTTYIDRSPCDSYISTISGNNSGSNRSSCYDSPDTEVSYWDEDIHKRDSDASVYLVDESPSPTSKEEEEESYGLYKLDESAQRSYKNVNAGCYLPTGMVGPSMSRFSQQRTISAESVKSAASSVYREQPQQAAEIEVEEPRGRRRSRALDRISRYGVLTGAAFIS